MKKKFQDKYSPFEKWQWNNFAGDKTINIDDFIKTNIENYFFIGTDSRNSPELKKSIFTTVLVAYKFGKGGIIIIHKENTRLMDSLRQRLLTEAMMSLEVGWFLNTKIPPENLIAIHLDVNASLKFKSGKYKDELVGLVAAQGFNAIVKPDAWAATSVADSKV